MYLDELLSILHYNQSPHYVQTADTNTHKPETAALFRSAKEAGVHGIYVFSTSPNDSVLAPQPAVYVAQAQNEVHARQIHQYLWNNGHAPFLIVLLPNHVRVYTGFDFSPTESQRGIVEDDVPLEYAVLQERLIDFLAESIDSGKLWQQRATFLKPDRRVDRRLLKSLRDLSGILRNEEKLSVELAHALIGKYVYIRYLRDRGILSDQWLEKNQLILEHIFGQHATVSGLQRLVQVLDQRFNGEIFPIDFDQHADLRDEHVALVASVFNGHQPISFTSWQLHLDFEAYNFKFIPIELLSSIYEQFLQAKGENKSIGAFYTPEHLADYLICEMQVVKPLQMGMRILDPSCGSGIFLVFAYRWLIETTLRERVVDKLAPEELSELLLHHIYGIEREKDACYVTEFSLLLTLLDYIDPPDLQEHSTFKFPSLHNYRIFNSDFFDESSAFWRLNLQFNWIIGNPPWTELKPKTHNEEYIRNWIQTSKKWQPIAGGRVAEAFSWKVTDVLAPDGIVGLILPAKSLFNHESRVYRKGFFQHHEVVKVTNFSNLRNVLFDGKVKVPAITIIYRKSSLNRQKPDILHYGPFLINQASFVGRELWSLTINEKEIQTISPLEAASGAATVWKFALWGTFRDKQAIKWLQQLFPLTLGQFCREMPGWHLREGPQLRNSNTTDPKELLFIPELEGMQVLDMDSLNKSGRKLSIPEQALIDIPYDSCYLRERGGSAGLTVTYAPHVFIPDTWNYVIYSDRDFVIPPRQIGISAPKLDADYLLALSLFLSCSVVRYFLFFQTPAWGVERNVITLRDAKSIPIPRLSAHQVDQLITLHRELAQDELVGREGDLQAKLDREVAIIVGIPEEISLLTEEFFRIRLPLNYGGLDSIGVRQPRREELLSYGHEMVAELDAFAEHSGVHHTVTIVPSPTMIVCIVQLHRTQESPSVVVNDGDNDVYNPYLCRVQEVLKQQFSQWVYVQRGLRIFDGPRAYMYKTPRILDWTRTQALNDADDIIAEVLSISASNE